MSLEDDILQTVRHLIDKSREVVSYGGVVQNVDTVNNIVSVVVDGANGVTPCVPLAHIDFATGQRVVILKASKVWYVVGIMAFKRVVALPRYSGSHPTGTNPGEMWYRDDLNHAYMNVNGTATQMV